MKVRHLAFMAGAATFWAFASPTAAQSKGQWIEIKNADELRALYSNKTFRGKALDGSPFVGYYKADGTGVLVWNNQRIPRTWEVKGSDQVCVTDARATNCYTYTRHARNHKEIVGRQVGSGWIAQFTVEDGVPNF
jgi:hypothetical protein